MLEKIKHISNTAIQHIDAKLATCTVPEAFKLSQLKLLYTDLLELIAVAEQQEATVGLWLLTGQLGKGYKNLNAIQLANNFLTVIHLKKDERDNSNFIYCFSKLLARVFLCRSLTEIIAKWVPTFILWGCSPLHLVAPLVFPLTALFVLSCLDDPYSMTRAYKELRVIEEWMMNWLLFNGGIVLLEGVFFSFLIPIEAFIVPIAVILASISFARLGFYQHEKILAQKEKEIGATVKQIEKRPYYKKPSFFNEIVNEHHLDAELGAVDLAHSSYAMAV